MEELDFPDADESDSGSHICTFMCRAWIAFGELTVVESWCWKVLDFSKKQPSCFPGAVEMLT